jgi:hypothetical protein
MIVVVAGQQGDSGEAETLVEAAVPIGGRAAQVAAARAEGGGAVAERLDQAAANARALPVSDHQQVVQARHAGDDLAEDGADQLLAHPCLDHHGLAGPVTVLAEDGPVGRGPLACEEAANVTGLLLGEPVGDLAGGSSGQLRTSLGDRCLIDATMIVQPQEQPRSGPTWGSARTPRGARRTAGMEGSSAGAEALNAKGARWTSVSPTCW